MFSIIIFIFLFLALQSQSFINNYSLNLVKKSQCPKIVTKIYQSQATENEFDIEADNLLIERLEREVMAEQGVELDQLLNAGKVVNLVREIAGLEKILEEDVNLNADDKAELCEVIAEKREKVTTEKRLVMRGWLKGLFVGQSVLAGGISLLMAYDSVPGQHLPLPVQVLGFWMWWLLIIPSLRARKPQAEEKEALNVAFLLTPLVSVAMPSFTKDTGLIWWGNAAAVATCYAWAYLKPKADEPAPGKVTTSIVPPILLKAWRALDYGSGQERGVRVPAGSDDARKVEEEP